MQALVKKVSTSFENLGLVGSIQQLFQFIYYYSYKILGLNLKPIKVKEFQLHLSSEDEGISRALSLYGDREQQFGYLLEKLIKPGMNILDIGANLGFYVLKEASLLKGQGKIWAVEPSPYNFNLLKKNIALNKLESMVTPLNMGFSSTSGKEPMFLSKCTNLNSFVSDMSQEEFKKRQLTNETVDIETISLSDFIDRFGNVDILRMDVEGYEVEVLQGARASIASGKFKGIITLETHLPQYNDKRSLKNELQFLFDHGYSVIYLTSNKEPSKTFSGFNLVPEKTFLTSPSCWQGIYKGVTNDIALSLITQHGGVRDVVLAKQ